MVPVRGAVKRIQRADRNPMLEKAMRTPMRALVSVPGAKV